MDVPEPEAAVAIVRARLPRESILLIRRSESKKDSWSGHWSFPGGRRDPDDPDLLHTALRELDEECGVRLGRERCEAILPPVHARRKTGKFVLVAPFVFGVDSELPTVVDRREAVEAVWLPQSVWCDPARHSLRPVPGRSEHSLFPAIDLNGVPLWGFTYRLATDWLGLLPTRRPIEQAGFEVACRVLDFLLSHGMELMSGWEDHIEQQETNEGRAAKVARVKGVLPVELVANHFGIPEKCVPRINLLDIRPDSIRVVGLAFEEYLISASR